jgi:hypothetical protein
MTTPGLFVTPWSRQEVATTTTGQKHNYSKLATEEQVSQGVVGTKQFLAGSEIIDPIIHNVNLTPIS